MRIELFKHEIKQYNGVWLNEDIMLLKRPLQLYDYSDVILWQMNRI